MNFTKSTLLIPEHWLSAIINGDETSFDCYDDPADYRAYQRFCTNEIGAATVSLPDNCEGSFYHYHDASPYGIKACNCVEATLLTPWRKYSVEHTDTFCGEANYSWCTRETIELPDDASDLAIVRKAKRAIGLSGVKCRRIELGETIELRPYGHCSVVFISPIY